jgi:ribonuclease D
VFISTADDLSAFCERAATSKVLAVDTEFLRERTYYPKLCLLQMAAGDDIVAVDPLTLTDLAPVADLFRDTSITKVIHACSQDLEVLYQTMGCVPQPVFDTQVAAAFLGFRTQLGYGPLVEAYTGVHLAKAESLTDWSKRPLDAEQLSYAEDDVRYLPQIYDRMMCDLVEKNRLSWLQPELASVCDPSHYAHDPREAYKHVKRVTSLTRRQLAVCREVAGWREARAQDRDIPRKWVMTDEVVLELSKRGPKDAARLHKIRGTEQVSGRDATAIVDAVRTGLSCPSEECPRLPKRSRPAPELESVVDLMYALVRVVSEKSGVATPLIATRDDLVSFAQDRSSGRLAEGWRHELVGSQLERLLDGQVGLTVKAGRIEVL